MKLSDARSLHGQVVRELGTRIVAGDLKPGDVLPREDVLAENMQVSRNALREALKVLAAKGLIEARPKTGTRIRPKDAWNQLDADILSWRCASMPTDDFIEKLVEMREIIEPAAAAAAARRRTPAQLAKIDSAYRQMEASKDSSEWAVADLSFHNAVLQATGNEMMISLFSVVESALGMFFVLSAQTANDFKYSLPHHQKALDAIRRNQPEVARKAMQAMIVDSRGNLEKRRKKVTRKAR
ncbi:MULTISPECIES: FadR/GntR family transcriptional regulator [Rhodanobacter]|uniref:FadR/GntR family transcriptional regulator n=1 Tax=Rhodanobacter TaxID=75309 RepID=UPI00041FA54C|nr:MULTISPECIES: FadR/GntR family transcriptional regulator [Rhodanobacter]TAN17299.1 MAG: FadR family transcriptional regulator [Rhodanobacter sp.]UJJ55735.1 FadR family transcriptional regulator [Rhodanobacter thiooxydans]